MLPGQHAIHDDDVVGLAGGEKQPVTAVVGVVGGVARLVQSLDDELRHPLVVLDQEELHGCARARVGRVSPALARPLRASLAVRSCAAARAAQRC